jgi:hypothetical protein
VQPQRAHSCSADSPHNAHAALAKMYVPSPRSGQVVYGSSAPSFTAVNADATRQILQRQSSHRTQCTPSRDSGHQRTGRAGASPEPHSEHVFPALASPSRPFFPEDGACQCGARLPTRFKDEEEFRTKYLPAPDCPWCRLGCVYSVRNRQHRRRSPTASDRYRVAPAQHYASRWPHVAVVN